MAKPKQEQNDFSYQEDINYFYQAINQLKDLAKIKLFLKDILTDSENRMLRRRWHIACLLNQGLDIRSVAKRAKVSTQTVVKIKRILKHGCGGLQMAVVQAIKQRKQKKAASINYPRKTTKNWWFFGKRDNT